MFAADFCGSPFYGKVCGWCYSLDWSPGGNHRIRVQVDSRVSAARSLAADRPFAGEGLLVISGPGGQLDEFNGIELVHQSEQVDRQRCEGGSVWQNVPGEMPGIEMSIGERRLVQPGALKDRGLLKVTADQQEPAHVLRAASFKYPNGSCAVRFSMLRRDEHTFMQHLSKAMSGPAAQAAELFVPFVAEYSGAQFPITSQTVRRMVVRQMAGSFLPSPFPSLEEMVRLGGQDPLVPTRPPESAQTLLDREQRWQLDEPIDDDIVEVTDLIFHAGQIDPALLDIFR